ncbi:MAG: hypothetical protein AAF587_27530 [Bacteroidota bacterium]
MASFSRVLTGSQSGYILICLDPSFAIHAYSVHPLFEDLMESAKIFLGPNVHLFEQNTTKLIFRVPNQNKSDFLDLCQQFRNSLLGLEIDGYSFSHVLLVVTMDHKGESQDQIIQRLMLGMDISQEMLASNGLCLV